MIADNNRTAGQTRSHLRLSAGRGELKTITEATADWTTSPASQSSRWVRAHPWARSAHGCPALTDI